MACYLLHGSLCPLQCGVCLKATLQADFDPLGVRQVVRHGSPALATEKSCAEQLAQFFPQASAVCVPVQVTSSRGGATHLQEATVVEFSSPSHAIFLSTLPLEFGDRVELSVRPEGNHAEATVDAVQYHEGQKAVAVRFVRGSSDWVVRQP